MCVCSFCRRGKGEVEELIPGVYEDGGICNGCAVMVFAVLQTRYARLAAEIVRKLAKADLPLVKQFAQELGRAAEEEERRPDEIVEMACVAGGMPN